MHFIEIPKLKDTSDEKDELIKMSNDSTQREIYDMRAKAFCPFLLYRNLENRNFQFM